MLPVWLACETSGMLGAASAAAAGAILPNGPACGLPAERKGIDGVPTCETLASGKPNAKGLAKPCEGIAPLHICLEKL